LFGPKIARSAPNVPLMSTARDGQPPPARDDVGTIAMLAGTAVSALSVLAYQPIAGRALGTDGFAPVAVLWTMIFLIYTVLMIPVEQFITRRLVVTGGGRGSFGADGWVVFAVLAFGGMAAVAFVIVTLDSFFDGEAIYIAIGIAIVVTRGLLAVGRGMLAGRRRFVAYGGTLFAEAVTLLSCAVLAAAYSPYPQTFAWALAAGPLTVLIFQPWRPTDAPLMLDDQRETAVKFLGWLIVATAASQIVIASGPIVVGLIGGTAAAVSIVFATFTLFRGPVTSAYNLVARVLPDFTELAVGGQEEALARWRHRIAAGGLALALVGSVTAYFLGPWIVEVLYGAEFRPPALVSALGGAAVGAGLGALFVGQIFIASGRTMGLAAGWAVALIFAAIAVLAIPGEPMLRIGWGFAVGELVALVVLGFAPRGWMKPLVATLTDPVTSDT